jgi:hypothetical protein
MARRGWRSRELLGPADVDGTGEMPFEVVGAGVRVEREAAVDDPDVRVAQMRGDAFGGPEKIRTYQRAHTRGHSTAALIFPRLKNQEEGPQ